MIEIGLYVIFVAHPHETSAGKGVTIDLYFLTSYDVENIGEFTRDNVLDWLSCHAGDFQSIKDFAATAGDKWIDWENEESEYDYHDMMFGEET